MTRQLMAKFYRQSDRCPGRNSERVIINYVHRRISFTLARSLAREYRADAPGGVTYLVRESASGAQQWSVICVEKRKGGR